MKALLPLSLVCLAASSGWAALGDARHLLEQKQPQKAAELLQGLLERRPDDPWLRYNAGVAAYAAKDYAKADQIWQELAATQLPDELRRQVWMQIGNVSYRSVEALLEQQPDGAVARLEQSREAYRVALAQEKRDKVVQQNLAFVEKQLEKVYARLAQRLVTEAKKENSAEKAIEKLEVALDYQRNATALGPKDPENTKAEHEIVQLLAEKFTKKAEDAEQQGDRTANQPNLDQWRRDAAQQQFENALADFKQAQSFEPEKAEAKEGEKRVTDKLANLFAQAGRQEQKKGNEQAKQNPQQAVERYEQALQNFDQALAVKSDHQDAQTGKEEVKQALEQLHLDQGDRLAKSGEQQAKQQPAEAAEKLLSALDHFEQAKGLDPENPTIPPRIEHVQQLLPDVLMAMAKREQQRAAEAEPRSPQNAVSHLERAEAGYDKAEQMSPQNAQAQQGQEEVQKDLARLRQQLAQQAEKKDQNSKQKGKQEPGFQAMLAELKAQQKDQEVNARHHAAPKYEPGRNPGVKNW